MLYFTWLVIKDVIFVNKYQELNGDEYIGEKAVIICSCLKIYRKQREFISFKLIISEENGVFLFRLLKLKLITFLHFIF